MNQQSGDLQEKFELRIRTVRILWFAMFMSVVLYYVLTFFVEPSGNVEPNSTLLLVLIGVALSITLVSFPIKSKILSQAVEQQKVQLVQQGYIVALALSEAPALLGLLDYFMTGDRYFYVLFLISVGAQLLHFPRSEHIINASAKRPIT